MQTPNGIRSVRPIDKINTHRLPRVKIQFPQYIDGSCISQTSPLNLRPIPMQQASKTVVLAEGVYDLNAWDQVTENITLDERIERTKHHTADVQAFIGWFLIGMLVVLAMLMVFIVLSELYWLVYP